VWGEDIPTAPAANRVRTHKYYDRVCHLSPGPLLHSHRKTWEKFSTLSPADCRSGRRRPQPQRVLWKGGHLEGSRHYRWANSYAVFGLQLSPSGNMKAFATVGTCISSGHSARGEQTIECDFCTQSWVFSTPLFIFYPSMSCPLLAQAFGSIEEIMLLTASYGKPRSWIASAIRTRISRQ
jgi:hypothetical protein